MIKSILHYENIEQFLKERYFIEREYINLQNSNNKNTKITFTSTPILEEIFIEKVLQDPYFSIAVCKMIEESDFNLNDVLAYVNYIILEKFLDESDLLKNSKSETTSPNPKGDELIENLIDKLLKIHGIDYLKFNDYYNSLWTKGDKLVRKTLESTPTRNQKIKFRWGDESPFSWSGGIGLNLERLPEYNKLYKKRNHYILIERKKKEVLDQLSLNVLRNQTSFLLKKIKLYMTYGNDKYYLRTSLFAFLNFNSEFLSKIKIVLEKLSLAENENISDLYIAKFLKLYEDAVFMAQLYWFNSCDENKKIEILNRYYDNDNLDISENNLNFFGNCGLLHYLTYIEARKLYEEKDYENAKHISNKVLKNTNDEFLKYLCVSLIAGVYQEKNDYNSALKYLEFTHDISTKFSKSTKLPEYLNKFVLIPHNSPRRFYMRIYHLNLFQFRELLNIAEMHCYLENKDKANECFKKLKDEIRRFSIPKRIDILKFLALSYECNSHQDFLKYRLYQKVVKLAKSYDDHMADVIEDDVGKKIFDILGFDEYLTKEICARKWIEDHRNAAIEHMSKIQDIPSEDVGGADLIKIYGDYYRCLPWNPENCGKIDTILRSSGLINILLDTDSVVPNTVEPSKLLTRIENAIRDLEKYTENIGITFEGLGYHDVMQRLNLARSRCFYALGDYNTAENILRGIISNSKDEKVLFNAYSILGLSLIKNWDIRTGINEFEKAVDITYQNPDLFEHCMYELLHLENQDIFYKVLDSLVDKINSNPSNKRDYWKNGYFQAAWQFNEIGLTEVAIHFIENGLSEEENELVRLRLLEEKAYISYLDEDYVKSESILNDILHISLKKQKTSAEISLLNSSVWHKISLICAKKHEFKKATKYIDAAISSLENCKNHNEEAGPYSQLKEIYNILSEHIILFDKINVKEVVDIFNTADEIVFNGLDYNFNTDFDLKLAFVSYGKGLETYLHDIFTKKLREYIFKKHQQPIDKKYWKSLDISLKNALNIDVKTISLGEWKKLINAAFKTGRKSTKNTYKEESYKFIKEFMAKHQWDAVAEACATVSEYRNGASHYGKGTLDDVLKCRGEIIKNINCVIAVMEKIPSSSI